MIINRVTSLFLALAALAATGCGDGTTTPGDPNRDRLEITFDYAGRSGSSFLIASMDLFQMTKDGRLVTPFVSTPYIERSPQWSNDGEKILFTNLGSDGASIWVANADLTGIRQVRVDANDQDYGSWSPKGDSIAFGGRGAGIKNGGTKRMRRIERMLGQPHTQLQLTMANQLMIQPHTNSFVGLRLERLDAVDMPTAVVVAV